MDARRDEERKTSSRQISSSAIMVRPAVRTEGNSRLAKEREEQVAPKEEGAVLTVQGYDAAYQRERDALKRRKEALLKQGQIYGSDDDSVLYCDRNEGKGVPNWNHDESRYDFDIEIAAQVIHKRRCRQHPEEHSRYVCKDHEAVLCARCLPTHKMCDFE